jgi:hypothetical protein
VLEGEQVASHQDVRHFLHRGDGEEDLPPLFSVHEKGALLQGTQGFFQRGIAPEELPLQGVHFLAGLGVVV